MIEIKWVDGAEFFAGYSQYKIVDGKVFYSGDYDNYGDWFESSYTLGELQRESDYTERPKQDDSTDEWPKVGDEVLLVSMGMTIYNKLIRLTYIGDGVGCYVDLASNMEYTYAKRETIFEKPKTPEEKLRDDIDTIIYRKFAELNGVNVSKETLRSMAESAREIILNDFLIERKPKLPERTKQIMRDVLLGAMKK